MDRILISACLVGVECKYCGGSNAIPADKLARLMEKYQLVPVCPEAMGGLPTPRHPSERIGDRVVSDIGTDVTAEYERGAQFALQLANIYGCKRAILKENSPSCGSGTIYDGTFSHTVVPGDGVTAQLLKQNGMTVYNERELDKLI